MTKHYKFLRPDGTSPCANYQYHLDGTWEPAVAGPLVECKNGYHIVDYVAGRSETTLCYWAGVGNALFEVEVEAEAEWQFVHVKNYTRLYRGPVRLVRSVPAWTEEALWSIVDDIFQGEDKFDFAQYEQLASFVGVITDFTQRTLAKQFTLIELGRNFDLCHMWSAAEAATILRNFASNEPSAILRNLWYYAPDSWFPDVTEIITDRVASLLHH